MVNLSERLMQLKIERNLLQKNIAKDNNITLRTYQRYENGEKEPLASTLITLAEYFNVSLDYLTGRTDEPVNLQNVIKESDKSIKPSHTNEEEELLDDFKLLDKYEKRIIKGRIAEMLYNKEIEKNSSKSEFSIELVNMDFKDKVNK